MWYSTVMEKLHEFTPPNTFNPYIQSCTIHDLKYGSKIRNTNLLSMLKYYHKHRPEYVFVSEALGFRGGKRTGLPLTDDFHIQHWNTKAIKPKIKNATKKPFLKEMTAKIVWKSLLIHFQKLPFLWNIFPFHPHKPDDLHSNRAPKKSEITLGAEIFNIILSEFNFNQIYAVGKQSYLFLKNYYNNVTYIRHPSHGGSKIFQKQVKFISANL